MTLKPATLQWSGEGGLQSLLYNDVYFQLGAGIAESRHVFLQCNKLTERFSDPALEKFQIAELGFGTGLNFLLTAQVWQEYAPAAAWLDYVSIEKHPLQRGDMQRIYTHWPELASFCTALLEQYPPLLAGFHTLIFPQWRIRLTLLFGDVGEVLPELRGKYDAWYLDGFTPVKNPEMWEDRLFPLLAARTKSGGTLSSFTAAGAVRRALAAAGFTVKKIPGYGIKFAMTVAEFYSADPAQDKSGADPAQGEILADVAPRRVRVAVLGAGIAGCAAAYALARRGYDVTLVDRQDDAGMETSGNPCGIVYPKLAMAPSPFGAYHQHAFLFARRLVTSLALSSWKSCGVMHPDLTAAAGQRTQALLEKNAFPPEYARFDRDPFSGRGGIWQEMAGYLSPPEFCRVLAEQPRIQKIYTTQIGDLKKTAHGWQILDKDQKTVMAADIVIIALNHTSQAFSQTAWLPLRPLRGQITILRATEKSRLLDRVISHDGYIVPAQDGQHVIGATFQREDPAKPEIRSADHTENIEKLNAILPEFGLTAAHVTTGRAGYRVSPPDKLPLIGPCPDYNLFLKTHDGLRHGQLVQQAAPCHEGLYITTGFGAHGMTGAPLAGEILAAMIDGAPLPVPESLLAFLLPERFIRRGLKRGEI